MLKRLFALHGWINLESAGGIDGLGWYQQPARFGCHPCFMQILIRSNRFAMVCLCHRDACFGDHISDSSNTLLVLFPDATCLGLP